MSHVTHVCVAVCCSVLQCVAVCCSALQVCCSVLHCVAPPSLRRKCLFSKAVVAKHLFAFSVFARGNSIGVGTDNSIDTELGKLLGYYPNNQHEMLHTVAAQQRPGNLPVSAPEASQPQSPRAQNQANPGRMASQRRKSQPGDTTAADRSAGTMDKSRVSRAKMLN